MRDKVAQVIGDMQFAPLLQDQDGCGSKFLGDGTKIEAGIGRIGNVASPVGQAIAFFQENLTVARDQDRAAEMMLCDLVFEEIVELSGQWRGWCGPDTIPGSKHKSGDRCYDYESGSCEKKARLIPVEALAERWFLRTVKPL